ncbi:MAG TPA: hypothetical protein DD638_06895, partial [Pasteurellaceae bacterium]|nr:hypothetical protein [Pasteurellaceae bacterium]
MTELLYLDTTDFELSIWCNGIEKRLDAYQKMLSSRDNSFEREYKLQFSEINSDSLQIFSQTSALTKIKINENLTALLDTPIFFENLQYQFEWIFKVPVNDVSVEHHLLTVNEAFRFSQGKTEKGARLVG